MNHPISGKPITIENPLLAEHVQVGRLLWYWGFTSVSEWNCPAVIVKVDEQKRQFQVCSLDDMRDQDQWYDYSTDKGAPTSRMTMRVATPEEVQKYLDGRRIYLGKDIETTKRAHDEAKKTAEDFDHRRKLLSL